MGEGREGEFVLEFVVNGFHNPLYQTWLETAIFEVSRAIG